jgi:putative acetyltransferase
MQLDTELDTMPEDTIEAIDAMLREAFKTDFEAKLVRSLRDDDLLVSEHILPVSDEDDAILAYIGYTEVEVEHGDADILGLGPMAVAINAQGSGVGLDFLEFSIEAMTEEGVDAIVLLGHTGFYSKAGFRPAADFGLTFGGDPANEAHFMALELKPGALSGCSGKITYASDFY